MPAQTVDSFEFCRLGERLSGATPVAGFDRLLRDLADANGEIRWRFEGGRHPQGLPQLAMAVEGEVTLVCQRCLAPFVHPIASETLLVLASDEASADEVEQRLDDDSLEVIAGSTALDLLQLVEDEALLSLPLSPRHPVCPGDVLAVAVDKPESPFAVLKKLKT
ncbi:MAG: YceD family protein [Burkholderiaceae bacterium]|nr:YceD family protein [Burkholderiaceae bacterium]